MSSFEFNKIFAAVLVAGIVAMLAGFIAEQLVPEHELEKAAVTIEGGSEGGEAGPAKASGPEPILDMIASADAAQGEKLSKACAACHSFDKGGAHKVGPNLWNIVGGPKGGKGGFDYSAAMAAKGGAWSYEDLNRFLWKPKKFVEGTKMSFVGLKKPEDRAAVIAWLRTMADSPDPLPSAAEIAKEKADLAPAEEAPAPAVEAAPAEEGAAAPAEEQAPAEEAPAGH